MESTVCLGKSKERIAWWRLYSTSNLGANPVPEIELGNAFLNAHPLSVQCGLIPKSMTTNEEIYSYKQSNIFFLW